ncbi:hypothetical protein EVAR_34203_1 [Eumeta japonica]|uniref:Uncharacterized protein n=1 Tax=Eumeta variegata TaxID=151549 RepID=A0A4C1WKQ6_EUMVA|nr:hypothetical protein EVAR_34203_1 [Eumeta japonica]
MLRHAGERGRTVFELVYFLDDHKTFLGSSRPMLTSARLSLSANSLCRIRTCYSFRLVGQSSGRLNGRRQIGFSSLASRQRPRLRAGDGAARRAECSGRTFENTR